jgi:DNA-binding NtrC family response regulator
LISYDWPGNVRELENAIERAVIIAAGRRIELDDLPAAIGNVAAEGQAVLRAERAHAASEGRTAKLEIDVPSSMDEIRTAGNRSHARLHLRRQNTRRPFIKHRRKTIYRKARPIQRKIARRRF